MGTEIDKFSSDFIVNFITKDSKYAIPSAPINIKGTSTSEDFENIIKTFIKENDDNNIDLDSIEFDFLIKDKLLRTSIQEFIKNENIDQELQIEIEYFVKSEPPKPHKSFLHDDWVSSVDTIDEWILSGCYDGTAHIWDARSGQHKIAIPAHTCTIKAVKWFRTKEDNYGFVTCSYDETAMLWNWNSKLNQIEHLHTYIGHCRSVDCTDSHNDLIATGSYDCMLKIWSITSQESVNKNKWRAPIMTLEGHKEAITGCTWLTDHEVPTIATVSLDLMMKIWDIEVGEQKQTFNSDKSFMDISYSPQTGLVVTASCDRHIRLWDLRQNQGSFIKQVYSSHELWVSSVAWSKENTNLFVSASYDSTVKQWDIRAPSTPLYDMLGHNDKVLSVNWSNNDFIVSGGADCQIKIFTT